jgi:hypothetical protein
LDHPNRRILKGTNPVARNNTPGATAFTAVEHVAVILHPVSNIIGPAYGAAMCGRASKVGMFTRLLLTEIEYHSDSYDPRQRIEWPDISVARNTHRVRAGEPPLPLYTRRLIPLTAAEHVLLGNDLKVAQRALVVVQHECHRIARVRRLADKTQRGLLQLRMHMETIVLREHPNGVAGNQISAIYFGQAPEYASEADEMAALLA